MAPGGWHSGWSKASWSRGWGDRSRSRSRSWHADGEREQPEKRARRRATPPAKEGQRWWKPRGREGHSYVGVVDDLSIPVAERGKLLGDRGSNVRRIVEVMRAALGHNEGEHARPPFVHFNEVNGFLQFELELYPPFDDAESFGTAANAFREIVEHFRENPIHPDSRHCLRPPRIQADDWECPNKECGNLCFARRKECPLCGAAKPRDAAPPTVTSNVPDSKAEPKVSRPPKHSVKLVTTAERLGPPEPGECQVVWCVPVNKRGLAIGKQGATARKIKEQTDVKLVLTNEPEIRYLNNGAFCMAFLRGPPENTKQAVTMVANSAGGQLATDGFEALLGAVEAELRDAEGCRRSLVEITAAPEVKASMAEARLLMRGAGLRSLVEVLENFPDRFGVQRTGPRGAVAELRDVAAPQPEEAWEEPAWPAEEAEQEEFEPLEEAEHPEEEEVVDEEFEPLEAARSAMEEPEPAAEEWDEV